MDEQLASQPWSLQIETLRDLCRYKRHTTAFAVAASCGFEVVAAKDREAQIVQYLGVGDPEPEDIGEGVRLIRLEGVMMKRPSVDDRYFFGARDVDELGRQMDAAGTDPGVRAVILAVDSPGGQVLGTPELASKVRSFTKPLAVYTDTLMASGAYWIGSQGPSVYSTPSAMIGSIGVYLPMYDVRGMLEKFGVKVDLIKSGKHKAAGFPGTELTTEQREFLQARVDAIHAEFRAAVKSRRRTVADSSMDGQVYAGKDAAKLGLVTGLASGIGEVASRLMRKN